MTTQANKGEKRPEEMLASWRRPLIGADKGTAMSSVRSDPQPYTQSEMGPAHTNRHQSTNIYFAVLPDAFRPLIAIRYK